MNISPLLHIPFLLIFVTEGTEILNSYRNFFQINNYKTFIMKIIDKIKKIVIKENLEGNENLKKGRKYNRKIKPGETIEVSDLKEAIILAALNMDLHAILINSNVFIEDPFFSRALAELFHEWGYSIEEKINNNKHFQFFLIVTNANSIEEAQNKALNLITTINSIRPDSQLDSRFFRDILNDTTPSELVDKIFTEYFCRPSIIIGPQEWVDDYLHSPELVGSALGAIVNISPDSSNSFNLARNALIAAILADTKSGIVPPDSCIEFKIQQIGKLIWAPEIPIPDESQDFFIVWRKLISSAIEG